MTKKETIEVEGVVAESLPECDVPGGVSKRSQSTGTYIRENEG